MKKTLIYSLVQLLSEKQEWSNGKVWEINEKICSWEKLPKFSGIILVAMFPQQHRQQELDGRSCLGKIHACIHPCRGESITTYTCRGESIIKYTRRGESITRYTCRWENITRYRGIRNRVGWVLSNYASLNSYSFSW